MKLSRAVRLTGAVCLVANAVLSILSVLVQPAFPPDAADRLAAVAERGSAATVAASAFTYAQLPFLVGVVVVALLCSGRAPRLALVGGVLAVLGGFGHAVVGGLALAQLAMADSPETAAMAEVLVAAESGPAIPFMAMGLLGTVLGLLLLGVALFRTRLVPRFIPLALWAFLVVEFVGASLSEWASPAAGALYLVALGGLAVHLMSTAPRAEVGETSGSLTTA